jgi:Zn-dependent dipeptidase, microsomal dipeptidase homolog
MGSPENHQYDGYQPFQYLDDDAFERYELPDSYQWGDSYQIELTEAEEERAAEAATDNLVFSLHDHPVYVPKDMAADFQDYASEGRLFTAYDALAKSPLDAVFDNVGLASGASPSGMKLEDVLLEFGTRSTDIAHQDLLVKAGSIEDIKLAAEAGQIAWVPAIETSRMIENELDRIELLFGAGIRKLGITYSESNALASGLGEKRDAGLTKFGEAAVDRMNDVGMAIGLSHASDLTVLDVCDITDDPVILSHNGSQELLDIPRLDPDEVLEVVADTGGVIGSHGRAAQLRDLRDAASLNRVGDGTLRVRQGAGRHRPRLARAGRDVRRPPRAPPVVRLRPTRGYREYRIRQRNG